MVAIHIFIIIRLGGTNMKKKRILEEDNTTDNIETNERRYRQMLQTNERIFGAIYNSFASYAPFCFYPYTYSMLLQSNPIDNVVENNEIEELLKKQDE
jgi:hypothetical protein